MLRNPVLDRRLTEAEASAVCSVLVTRLGGSYSRLLGIKLDAMGSDECFKWLVAAILLGSPVRAGSALAAYRRLESLDLLEARRLATVNDQVLVDVLLSAGVTGYTRRIAATLRLAVESLVNDYDGDVNRLHFFAEDGHDLVNRLRQLGRKVPRRAVSLFLREMRGVWDKAHPGLPASAVEAASCLGIVGAASADEVADELHTVWERANHGGRSYADFEVALVRLGENYCEMRRCVSCPMGKLCVSRNDEELR
jgi:endonuclease III